MILNCMRSLTLKPLLKNQELVVTESTGNTYWEGAVAIEGQSNGQSVNGQGYVELTGYTEGGNGPCALSKTQFPLY